MTHDFREKPGRSHCQECSYGKNANHCSGSKIFPTNKTTAKAIPYDKIENHNIQCTRNQPRGVSVLSDGPINMHGKCVRNKPGQPNERYNDPMTFETIKENV